MNFWLNKIFRQEMPGTIIVRAFLNLRNVLLLIVL